MKKLNISIAAGLIATSLFSSPAGAADIKVVIDKVSHSKGLIYAQIFKGQENYHKGKALSGQQHNAKSGPFILTFNNMNAGEYAVRVFHDENNNGKLDKNKFGVPTEGYAFSNEARANYGPASYQDMKFTVTSQDIKVITKAHMAY